jgi:nucleoside 2-deoxyribosyltransferase
MKPAVVYVAGPIRAESAWQREQNIRRAEALALEVWRRGCAAICVHAAARFYDEAEARENGWLELDLELLRRCDAVLVVEGSDESKGTQAEIALAERIGIPVHHNLCQLDLWLAVRRNVKAAPAGPVDRAVEQIASWIEGHGVLAIGLAQGVRTRAWDGLTPREASP